MIRLARPALRPGEPVVLMGPTGSPAHIAADEKEVVAGRRPLRSEMRDGEQSAIWQNARSNAGPGGASRSRLGDLTVLSP